MTIKSRPSWLTEIIEDQINIRSEYAQPGRCPKCHSAIWKTVIPFILAIDPEPLDAKGEFEALMAGCATYRVQRINQNFWPIWRSYADITFSSEPDQIYLADHRCKDIPLKDLPHYWPQPVQPDPSNERCPF